MATRARNRIVVKSKSKSSMVTSTSSSSEFSSEGPFIAPLTSTPAKPLINSTADANPNSGTRPRSHARFKSKGNKVKPAPIIHPPPRPHSVSGSVMASHRKHRESSSSEGDNVFTMQGDLHLAKTTPITNNRPQNFRPMYLSSSQLLPSLYYKPVDNQFPRNSGNRHNQILPVLNLQPNSMSVSSQFYHSYLSSPSPTTDANSTFSSLSSPLPPLLVQSMRKGGTKPSALSNWQSDSVLENILPGGVLKVFIGTWNMYEQKVGYVQYMYRRYAMYMYKRYMYMLCTCTEGRLYVHVQKVYVIYMYRRYVMYMYKRYVMYMYAIPSCYLFSYPYHVFSIFHTLSMHNNYTKRFFFKMSPSSNEPFFK